MPLVGEESRLASDGLQALYREHREAIVELRGTFEQGPSPVADLQRWMTGRSLAEDVLRLLPEDPKAIPPERLRLQVNLAYDVMVVLIDLMKLAYGRPRVPGSKPG